MKKIGLILLLIYSTCSFGQKREKIGIQVNGYLGVPVGLLSNDSNFNYGVSVGYLGKIENFFRVGGSIGYDHTVLNKASHIPQDRGFQYLFVGASAELDVYKKIYIAADLGYAFNQTKNGSGSHYFTPKVGYHYSDDFNFYLHYKGVRYSIGQVASIGAGLAYNF